MDMQNSGKEQPDDFDVFGFQELIPARRYQIWLIKAILYSGAHKSLIFYDDATQSLFPKLGIDVGEGSSDTSRQGMRNRRRLSQLSKSDPPTEVDRAPQRPDFNDYDENQAYHYKNPKEEEHRIILVDRLKVLYKLQDDEFHFGLEERNLSILQTLFGFSNLECDILFFFHVFQTELDQSMFWRMSFTPTSNVLEKFLALVLNRDVSAIQEVMGSDSLLLGKGLIMNKKEGTSAFKIEDLEISSALVRAIQYQPDTFEEEYDGKLEQDILAQYFRVSSDSKLTLDDFDHLKDHLDVLRKYLKEASDAKSKGVNVLLYGPPGTGKTQLAKILAREIGSSLHEVVVENETGWPYDARDRLSRYLTCQLLSKRMNREAIILFDEIEGVLNTDTLKGENRSNAQIPPKAWLNRLMETNQIPTIWISNTLFLLDPALLRRFDYVLEVGIPPSKARRRIFAHYTKDLGVDKEWLHEIATKNEISPAEMERGAKIARSVSMEDPELVIENFLKNAFEARASANPFGSKKLQGIKTKKGTSSKSLLEYDVSYLNADWDMDKLTDMLVKKPSARICLYGPPGTGKSAYVGYLGKVLARRVIQKRMSDLQSMWVGETEKNIAAAFREALDEDTILLVDEADSLIRDRSSAQRSWEVSQVNEFLTQMENFDGILVCSTNMMDTIDQASMRRFDLKIKFGYLEPDAAWKMFIETARHVGCYTSDEKADRWRSRIRSMTNLAPGDFAVVCRQARLRTDLTLTEIYEILRGECEVKSGGGRSIGGFGRR